jgi:Lon protease-like protein
MTKRCIRDERPFGVCLIREGHEVGTPAVPATVGCLAAISHWDMPHTGLFTLLARGGARFRILEQSVDRMGLISARVECWEDDPPGAVMDGKCRRLLEGLIARAGAEHFPEPLKLDDPAWVGFRLAEILPLPAAFRQELLELRDAGERLRRISALVTETPAN